MSTTETPAEPQDALKRIRTAHSWQPIPSRVADLADMQEQLDDAKAQQKQHYDADASSRWEDLDPDDPPPHCGFCTYDDRTVNWPCRDRLRADRTTARVLAWALRHGGGQ